VKVPLSGITWQVVEQARGRTGRLEARYAASREDGRPVFASVPLLGEGWVAR
jgi:hypothetical protein